MKEDGWHIKARSRVVAVLGPIESFFEGGMADQLVRKGMAAASILVIEKKETTRLVYQDPRKMSFGVMNACFFSDA
jgi:hypothetical protein